MRYFGCLPILLPSAVLAADTTSANAGDINWDLVLKALGFIVAAVVAYFQLRNLTFAARASLKTDLEILKLLKVADPNYQTVKRAVDERISDLYAERPAASPAIRAELLTKVTKVIGGGVWALGFAYWTVTLVQPTFSWWALLTGYLAFGGLGLVVMGFGGKPISRHR